MTACTDDERRRVAERLRRLDYADLQESLICAYLDALGIKGYEDWIGIAHRLADLIDPDCDEGRYEGVHTARPVDREALLALAEEIKQGYVSGDTDGDELVMSRGAALLVVLRIREACGEAANGLPTGSPAAGVGGASEPQAGGPSGRPGPGAGMEKN